MEEIQEEIARIRREVISDIVGLPKRPWRRRRSRRQRLLAAVRRSAGTLRRGVRRMRFAARR